MRLSASQAATILSGQKTQHRVLLRARAKKKQERPVVSRFECPICGEPHPASFHGSQPAQAPENVHRPFKIGETIPIQTERTEKDPVSQERVRRLATAFHVRVTALYDQELCEVSAHEAKAEGFPSLDAFFDHWQEKTGTRPMSLATGEPIPVYGMKVIVVCFEATEKPRYPAPTNRSDSEGRSYVHSPALAIDDQSVDAETQERISKGELRSVSQRQFEQEHQAERAAYWTRPLHEQVRELEEAHRQGYDVHHTLAAIRRRVEAGQKKITRDAA